MATDAQAIVDAVQATIPALASVSDAALLPHAAKNLTQWSAAAFGDMYVYAMVYATAHEYQLLADAGTFGASAAGPIQSKKAGNVSISFVGSSVAHGDLSAYYSRTVYGQMFDAIRLQRAAAKPGVYGPGGL